tara:strand:- start:171 stop:272 length:102 start_codon:yes stop_codon:yes gene_type:complete
MSDDWMGLIFIAITLTLVEFRSFGFLLGMKNEE